MKKRICLIFLILTIFVAIFFNNTVNATVRNVITGADGFITTGEGTSNDIISTNELNDLTNTVYKILVIIGIIIAVIVGAVLGIKFITEGAEGKAEVQKALIAYVIGCVVIFGAFVIWKIVVEILQGI